MDADGGNKKQLTDSPMNEEGKWSPDGRRIAYISHPLDSPVSWLEDTVPSYIPKKMKSEIWVMNSDGSDKELLLNIPSNNGVIMDMECSPDGTKIAFTWLPNTNSYNRTYT
jgi:Tol biopolymer transport system component